MGVFHSKGIPGDVPRARVYFFKLSSLAKGILLPILVHLVWARVCFLAVLVDFSLGKGTFFWQFWSKKCQTSVIPVKKLNCFFLNFGPENAKIWQVLSRKCQFMALLM